MTAFVTLMARNEVGLIDLAQLALVGRIKTGREPMGLVLLDPTAG